MIISFSGAQSTGKSTLLASTSVIYDGVYDFVEEVTRLVKRTYDVKINEHANDTTQLLILNQHLINSTLYTKDVIMDRCILDGLVYTEWLASKNVVSNWVLEYAKNLYKMLMPRIDVLFYCEPDFDLVLDGERSSSVEFRNEIIKMFNHYLETGIHKYNPKLNLVRLSGTVDERIKKIKYELQHDKHR